MLTMLYQSPAGPLLLVAEGRALTMCDWPDSRHHSRHLSQLPGGEPTEDERYTLDAAAGQLDEYFSGERRDFTMPLAPHGTDFQRRVWSALLQLPFGATLTYAELADRVGEPRAVRAVASAVGANPLSIIIPCHRIVPAAGGVGQYAGGADVKRFILDIEHVDYHPNR